jgi:hypothetical protein
MAAPTTITTTTTTTTATAPIITAHREAEERVRISAHVV